MSQGQIKVKQIRGLSGQSDAKIRIIQGLGLGRIGKERVHKDNNCIRGMINKVHHLVSYELISG